jgi:hypothetical protein
MLFNRKTSFFAVLIAVLLAAILVWALNPRGAAPVQAGGGQATMNQMFTSLLTQNNYTVTLRLIAPVNDQTEIILTNTGGGSTYSFERNGADHLCVKGPDPSALTDCIPFSNIASFSYEGPLQ